MPCHSIGTQQQAIERAQWWGSSWWSEGRSGRRRLGKHSRVSSLSPDSRRSGEPFSKAVYEEIEYSPVREKKMRYSFSGGCRSMQEHI